MRSLFAHEWDNPLLVILSAAKNPRICFTLVILAQPESPY
jgi:hypothetical protein